MKGGGNFLSWVIGACQKHVGNHEFVTITETCLKFMLSKISSIFLLGKHELYKAKPVAMEISLHISMYEWMDL